MMNVHDLLPLLEVLKNPEATVLDLSAAASQARREIRLAHPPESLPPLICELGALTVTALHLPPYHGLGLLARDAQPIRFADVRVQREWRAYEVTNDIEVEVSFPVLGVPGRFHESKEITAWKKHNMGLVKKNFTRYIRSTLPLIERHWEYKILISLLQHLDRLAGLERDADEVQRMLTVVNGTAEMRKRYRGAAGTLSRPPR
jgi:hypothetical protein